MPNGQQHSRRRNTRLLLLAAAGAAAGFGLSLAVADDAHAADRAAGIAELPTSAVNGIANETVGPVKLRAPDRGEHDAPPRRSDRVTGNVKPHARDVAVRSTGMVDDATRSARSATREVAAATSGLPVPTDLVEETGDLAGDVIDQVEGAAPSLPRLPTVDVAVPSISDRPAGDAQPSPVSPQTAPESAEGDAPTPPAAGSGAPSTLPASAAQHPAAGTTTETPPAAAIAPPVRHAFTPQPMAPQHPEHTAGGEHSTVGAGGGHAPGGTIMDGWATPTEWQLAVIRYIGHHHGRTHSPSPPSG